MSDFASGSAADISFASEIPCADLRDYEAGGDRRAEFVSTVGSSLAKYGSLSLENHALDEEFRFKMFETARLFFELPEEVKRQYYTQKSLGQRGFSPLGSEKAIGASVVDYKEFYQVGRVNVPDDHRIHQEYGPNLWPNAEVADFENTLSEAYLRLEGVAQIVLRSCAHYLQVNEELFAAAATESDTVTRYLHYPPLPGGQPAGTLRAAPHEDINLCTLLIGSTQSGLEILGKDNKWIPIPPGHAGLEAHCGDMLQSWSNGIFRSTTHRVVNPNADQNNSRYSIAHFIHPRREIDITPHPTCVVNSTGKQDFPSQTAQTFLHRRLQDIRA